MSERPAVLTSVLLRFEEGVCNYRLVFGQPAFREPVDNTFGRRIERVYFPSGAVFCLDLWEPTAKGRTKRWKTFVLQAGWVGDQLMTVPHVKPGAHVLMEATGSRRCKFLLAWLATLEPHGPLELLPANFYQGRDLWFQGMVPEQWDPNDLNQRA